MNEMLNIGCGQNPTPGWVNVDNTPAIKLANSPIRYRVAKLLRLLNNQQIESVEWNKKNSILYADATKKLPFESSSISCIYSSHMLEHLSREGARKFLRECMRVLVDGGCLRLAVPDLGAIVNEYIRHHDADAFMERMLVAPPALGSLRNLVTLMVTGYRHHQWMYDGSSLVKLLHSEGFCDARIYSAGETRIINAEGLDLDERKEESVYAEALKPELSRQ